MIYDNVKYFSEDLSAVEQNGKWGFIDRKGNTVIKFQYDDAGYFSEDLVAVKQNDKWGYINKNGETVIDFGYKEASSFKDGISIVSSQDEKYKLIDKEGIDRSSEYKSIARPTDE